MSDLSHPAIRKVVDVASRKGVQLEIRLIPGSTRNAREIAAAVDADLGQIVESLVFVAERSGDLVPIVCLVSAGSQVDPALLAAVTGQVSVRIATARETHELTGHSAGEVPPFGHGRDVRIVMDRDLSSRQWVWASAGTSHAHLHITPRTLRMLANAVVAPLAQRPGTRDLERTAPMLSLGARAGAVAGAGAGA